MDLDLSFSTFLLAFTALFSIVNPLSGAFIFFGATRELDLPLRSATARWVAIYAFCIVAASLYIGAYVLGFFGVSLPVLRVAGGIIVAAAGWRMLNAPDVTEHHRPRHDFGCDIHRRRPPQRIPRIVGCLLRRNPGCSRAAVNPDLWLL